MSGKEPTPPVLAPPAPVLTELVYAPPSAPRRAFAWALLEAAAVVLGVFAGLVAAALAFRWFDRFTPINSHVVFFIAVPLLIMGGAFGGSKGVVALRRRARVRPGIIRPAPPLARLAPPPLPRADVTEH